jgi:hypothetical protein
LPEYQHTVSKSHIYLLHPTAYSEIWDNLTNFVAEGKVSLQTRFLILSSMPAVCIDRLAGILSSGKKWTLIYLSALKNLLAAKCGQ